MSGIAILGAGMAGFGAVHRLREEGVDAIVYEKRPYHGGHTASHFYESGFTFDEGAHISFTKDERIQNLFAESVQDDYRVLQARVNNYWQGHWIKHPVQCNLHGLPVDLVTEIMCDMISGHNRWPGAVSNYAEWLIANYGRRFAETFPMQYGRKYHTAPASDMSIDWIGGRIYQPKLEEVIRGALSPDTADVHYVSHFRYPSRKGFVSYLNLFKGEASQVKLEHTLIGLDPATRIMSFSNGKTARYDHLISSIPLPELIAVINGVPNDVVDAAGKLACSTCVLVNIGIDRADLSDSHWTYFYDDEFAFTRVSFPHMFSPNNAPPGAGSIQAELYYSQKYRPLDVAPEDCIDPVIADLRRCGLVREDDRILFRGAMVAKYANVIFDLDRESALQTVHGYLRDIGVAYCGRFGDWAYSWTDQAFLSGEGAAQTVLDRFRG